MYIEYFGPDDDHLDDDDDISGEDRGDSVDDDSDEKTSDDGKKAAPEKDEESEEGDEEEGDEDEEEGDDEEGDDGKKKDPKNLSIRLTKALAQRDADREALAAERQAREALAARLLALEKDQKKGEPAPDPIKTIEAELDELYVKVEEARADADTAEAAKLQRQIDSKNREIARLEATMLASTTTTEAQENARYDAMLEQMEAEIPAMNPASPEFNPKAVRALEYYVEANEKMGKSPTQALRMARALVFGLPEKKAAPEKDDDKKVVPLKPTDVKKAKKTADGTPPDLSTRGANKDGEQTIDPDKLSDDEWDALPETKKRALRGDFLA